MTPDVITETTPDQAAMSPRMLSLELVLPPAEAARLPRMPELVRPRGARVRGQALRLVWHDTPEGELAADGLALAERRLGRETEWVLERMYPADREPWPPATPSPLLGVATAPDLLDRPLPGPLMPVVAFEGQRRILPAGTAVAIVLLEGTLRAVAGEQPVCRLLLEGPAPEVEALALALAGRLDLEVPRQALAAEAFGLARTPPPPRRLGAPRLLPGLSVSEAFAFILGHLTDVILHWAPLAVAGASPEPVHQMRVATRRLRSAVSLFKRAVRSPELDSVKPALKTLGRVLGPARDWDVFTSGTGHEVAEVLAEDERVIRLLATAEKRRRAGYAALSAHLASPEFRRLGLQLAMLAAGRPWEELPAAAESDGDADRQANVLAMPLRDFAAHALTRRHDAVLDTGEDITPLPPKELHQLRIRAKRLRYAAEFFAPLFPSRDTRRFIRRVTVLQERLGHLNDSAVASELMSEIGGNGGSLRSGTGRERGYAAGVVLGFVAAHTVGGRESVFRTWRKFRRADPFWD
jgi:CHAD domain-containing protein